MSTHKWDATDLPDLSGRTIVVTGANSGIGLTAARGLAGAGAHVVLAVRDRVRGEQAAETVTGSREVRELDLADLASVRAFAEAWDRDLDVLVNNAGVMAVPAGADPRRVRDADRHQPPRPLRADQPAAAAHHRPRRDRLLRPRHRLGAIRLDDLNWEHGDYQRWPAYGQSKLANLLFTLELQRRLTEAGSPVRALAAHPGWSATNLQSRTENPLQQALMALVNRTLAQSDEMGALPTLFAATQDLPGAAYVGPDGIAEQRGHPALVGRSARASDPETARRLWELSERLTGVTFPLAERVG